MISVVIVGSGNVARHLIKAFLKIDNINLKQVYTRNSKDLALLKNSVSTTNDLSLIKQGNLEEPLFQVNLIF
jgi:pyrroline-5-carboxylate reductase